MRNDRACISVRLYTVVSKSIEHVLWMIITFLKLDLTIWNIFILRKVSLLNV